MYLFKALKNLCPEAEFTFQEEDYLTITWIKNDGKAPTQKQIDDEIAKIKAGEDAVAAAKAEAKAALLDRLGITSEEAKLLLS
jgi:hypothetical protein